MHNHSRIQEVRCLCMCLLECSVFIVGSLLFLVFVFPVHWSPFTVNCDVFTFLLVFLCLPSSPFIPFLFCVLSLALTFERFLCFIFPFWSLCRGVPFSCCRSSFPALFFFFSLVHRAMSQCVIAGCALRTEKTGVGSKIGRVRSQLRVSA